MKCKECGRYAQKGYLDRRTHDFYCVECFEAMFGLIGGNEDE